MMDVVPAHAGMIPENLGPVHLPPICATAGPAAVTAITESGPDPTVEVEYVRSLPLVIGQLSTAI